MKLIELLSCMEKGCRIKIHCPQVNGQYRYFDGTKDEMFELKEELIWAGNVAVVRAAREGLLEVWTRLPVSCRLLAFSGTKSGRQT